MKTKFIALLLGIGVCAGTSSACLGHEIFQDVLKERYTLKSFSCKTCHPDNDDKKIRAEFAELIYQELKDKNLSEKFAAAEAIGEDAVSEFETMVAKDFKEAMVVVGKKQMTFDQLFAAGLFYGARLDTKKIEEMAAAGETQPADEPESTTDEK